MCRKWDNEKARSEEEGFGPNIQGDHGNKKSIGVQEPLLGNAPEDVAFISYNRLKKMLNLCDELIFLRFKLNGFLPMNSLIDAERFGGVGRLYGRDALERLARAHVAVIGVGGVGSWTVEALARSGVGRLTLIDLDDVCITNTNRQLPALEGQIGRPKVEVLADRVRLINPACVVDAVTEFFLESSADRLLAPACQPFDWVVDAVDRAAIKTLIITKARAKGISVLTVGGAGGRRDATQVRCGDLGSTGGDALLKQVRRELRRTHGWANGAGNDYGVPAVYSAEPQMFPQSDGTVCAKPEAGENLRMDCASGYGAACFVTGVFGFAAAGEIVRQIALTSNP